MIHALLDEDVDVRLRSAFGADIHVETVAYRGWKGKKNGELLRLAQDDFDVLISADQNLPFQQSIAKFAIGVVLLCPRSKTLEHLIELVPEVLVSLRKIAPGQVVLVRPPGLDAG